MKHASLLSDALSLPLRPARLNEGPVRSGGRKERGGHAEELLKIFLCDFSGRSVSLRCSFTSAILLFFSLLLPLSLHAQDWHWQNPLPQGNSFGDIHIFDGNNAIAVGDGGTVLSTTDGGTTWTSLTSGVAHDLASVFFIDANEGWAVGDVGTILHTTDGGATWVAQISGTTNDLSSVQFIDASTGWASGGRYSPSASTIRHTTNGGATWTTQVGGTPDWLYSIFFLDANTGWAVGETGTIIHTTNGGTTWSFQIEGDSRCLYSVFFADANMGWAVGHTGSIRHTTNGGTTWTSQSSGVTDHLHSVFFTDANTGWVVGAAGSFLQTIDGGAMWTSQTSGTTNQLESVSFSDPNTGWVVGDYGTILHTVDAGIVWAPQTTGPTDWLYSVFFANANSGWAVGDLGTILHTANGGETWIAQQSGLRKVLSSVIFPDLSNGWVVGELGTILHTSNGGGTWRDQTSGITDDLTSVFFLDANTGWASGAAGTILHTVDGGATWSPQTSGAQHDLSSICFTDANTGWAIGGQYSPAANTILHTTNGGATWTTQTSGTTNQLESGFFTDANTGWTVGDLGMILHTTDGGATWTPQASGTTNYLCSISFTDANMGWAVGDTGTILHTTNGGTTWNLQASGTTNPLESVFFTDANTGWTFGAGGTILNTTTGGTGIDPPAAPTLVSPLDGSTVSTSPLLSWSDVSSAQWYSIQVSNSPLFVTYVVNQTNIATTSYQLSGLEGNETYYWRVSLTDGIGTSGWSETWSFIVGSAPNQIALVTPLHGDIVFSDSAVFAWRQGFPMVDRYWFEYSTDSTFAVATTDSSLSDTTTVVHNLQHHQTYYWRVRAHNEYGWGPSGDAWSFLVLNTAPGVPLLVSPPDGVTGQPLSITFTWRTVSSALLRQSIAAGHDRSAGENPSESTDTVWYHLQLALDSGFNDLLLDDSTLVDTSAVAGSLGENTAYYWRVRARNLVGGSPWSDGWSFTTLARPARVVLTMPEDGAVLGSLRTDCSWLQSTPGVDRYWFEWALDSNFTGSRVDSLGTDTTYAATGLQNNRTYYWKVRAHNEIGWGEFSDVWSFSVLITDVDNEEQLPVEYSLNQNYPNPFNPSTTIRYGLPQQAHVMLEVFNMLGQKVAVLRDEKQEAGYHEVTFEAASLSSGLYFYRLQARHTDDGQAGGFVETKRLVLVK